MQIQGINSYNTSSKVNFKASLANTPADFACLLPNAQATNDVYHALAKELAKSQDLPGAVLYKEVAGDIMGSGYGIAELEYRENGNVVRVPKLRIPVTEKQEGVTKALLQLFSDVKAKIAASNKQG